MGFWAEVRNNYFEDGIDPLEGDVLARISIDGWKTQDENEDGHVIARVLLSKHGDILVDYHDNVARRDEMAQEAIQEAITQIKDYFMELNPAAKKEILVNHVTLVRERQSEGEAWSDNFWVDASKTPSVDLFKAVVQEYLLTPGGKQDVEKTCNDFNWGDAIMYVPLEFWESHGIFDANGSYLPKEKGLVPNSDNNGYTFVVDQDEVLIPESYYEQAQASAIFKAINIIWDVDCEDANLPAEIKVPVGMEDEDDISDYISEVTGYCHKGFQLVEMDTKVSLADQIQSASSRAVDSLSEEGIKASLDDQIPTCPFNLGDKVKKSYISDCNPHNNAVGEVTWINRYKFYPGGDINNYVWKYQMQITYPDGSTEMADPLHKGSGLVSPVVLVEAKSSHLSLDSVIQTASNRVTEAHSTKALVKETTPRGFQSVSKHAAESAFTQQTLENVSSSER